METWVQYYMFQVSNTGQIKNKQNKILSQFKLYHKGKAKKPNTYYWCVESCGKRYKVHQLVAYAFLPPKPEGLYCIDHIDGNKDNNNANNLQWLDWIENSKKGNKPLIQDENKDN